MNASDHYVDLQRSLGGVVARYRTRILVFAAMAAFLAVIAIVSAFLAHRTLRAYASMVHANPPLTLRSWMGGVHGPDDAPRVLAKPGSDEAAADREYATLRKALEDVELLSREDNRAARERNDPEDIIDERIFVGDHDEYTS